MTTGGRGRCRDGLSSLNGLTASRLGLGCYRMSSRIPSHTDAMRHALDRGCTLIDTASNYGDGGSEELVGGVLSGRVRGDVVVLTKGGYISPSFMRELGKLDIHVPEDHNYSLAPDALRASFDTSLNRLQSDYVDGYLLHNPERLFEELDPEVDTIIIDAFTFLQEQIDRGRLGFFGVSSSQFSIKSQHGEGKISLPRLLSSARKVSQEHGLRVVEMPCNIIEKEAVLGFDTLDDSKTLRGFASHNGLVTIANRPINARINGEWVRLSEYAAREPLTGTQSLSDPYAEFVEIISDGLQSVEGNHVPSDFPVMRFLRDAWSAMKDPDLVDHVFASRVAPFVATIFSGELQADAALAFEKLRRAARDRALVSISETAHVLRQKFVLDGIVDATDTRQLSLIAAEFPIQQGFDHVLVGMREPRYVDDLSSLFNVKGA